MGSLGTPRPVASAYLSPHITERPIDSSRSLKVIYIGAGISGILAAILFPKTVPNLSLTIYEKNASIGGTWYENRYPGCACDIPAHSYQASFESNPNWSSFYAGAKEILAYWRRVAEKHDVERYVKLRHRCREARWNEETKKWHVKIEDLSTGTIIDDVSDVFMLGVGALNEWRWPEIKGLKDFQGPLLHSANWDESFDPKGKKVAVIGAGSSGIQIVPTLLPDVERMDHYVRGRTWIAATFGNELVRERNDGADGNFEYAEEEKEVWRRDKEALVKYRKALEVGMQGGFAVAHRDTPEHRGAREMFDKDMRKRLALKPEIIEHLLPDFPPLCKRLTPGPGYLEALTEEKVDVVATPISHVDAKGIVTRGGRHRAVDAIVCATGFDTSFRGRFPIYGRGGLNMQERYAERPTTYLSVTSDGFPNFFQSLGPNAGLGNGNLLILIEAVHGYVGQILRKMAFQCVRTIEPKRSAVENFTKYCDAYFQRTVFSAECASWYKSAPKGASVEEKNKGRITALWPGSSLHAVKALERVRFEDFEMELTEENEMAWFGDGWTVAERVGDSEGMSYYLNGSNILTQDVKKDGMAEEVVAVNGVKEKNERTHGQEDGTAGLHVPRTERDYDVAEKTVDAV